MRITWGHLAAFLVLSTAVFALGIARGKQRASNTRQAYIDRELPGTYVAQTKRIPLHESTFNTHIPPYPRRLGPEIAAGNHRDAFGLPTKAKVFNTKDQPEEVLVWYERHFKLKSYKTYTVKNELLAGLAAIDTLRKQMYYVTAIRQGKKTMVIPAWVDGTKQPDKKTYLIPLESGRPVMLSGDGKMHEMAVYMVDEQPSEAYERFSGQLSEKGWRENLPPTKEGRTAEARKVQRSYVHGDKELMMTARRQGNKTVVVCMVAPRVG